MIPTHMHAAVLHQPGELRPDSLSIEQVPVPKPSQDQTLLRVLACGVCRTDLHIIEGELPPQKSGLIPGHQIVAEVMSPNGRYELGERVGVSWMGGVDGCCRFCSGGRENLCDTPTYTGYNVDGGYAEYAVARTDFLIPLPAELAVLELVPLLCAGIIGYRSLRVAEVRPSQRVGLFGFGSSAQLVMKVLNIWGCEVYVSTRDQRHQKRAEALGAAWVGDATARTPVKLDAAVTFAPSGEVVLAALQSLDKGAVLAVNAIHLDAMPRFDYDTLLWGERQIRSVTNMTRQDAREFLDLAVRCEIQPQIVSFGLGDVNEALLALKGDRITGSAAILLRPF